MKFLFLFLIFCLTDAKQVSCGNEVCTFSGDIDSFEYANVPLLSTAYFDAGTTSIGANAFYNSNISSVIFESPDIDIDKDAFDFIPKVTVICNRVIMSSVYFNTTVYEEYGNLRQKCFWIKNNYS